MCSPQGNILDDEQLINTLNNSKLTSAMIANRLSEAEHTELSINEARESYRPAATRGSILYFVIADLALISPMYQFSLSYFIRLFAYCTEKSEKSDDVPTRLQLLSDFVTKFIYNNVQRGLFEEHKLLYAFLVCTSILRDASAGEITPGEWSFFVRGVVGKLAVDRANPAPEWITPNAWTALQYLDVEVPPFKDICANVADNLEAWHHW